MAIDLERVRKVEASFKPDKRMQAWFKKYNKWYWDNKLPNVQVGWANGLSESMAVACTIGVTDDETKHTIFVIYLDPALKPYNNICLLNLLHEMAHVALFPYIQHGKKFDDEMLRLASRGAFDGRW